MATLTRTNHALAIPPDRQYDVVANVYEDSALLQLADVRQMTSAVQDVITAGSFTFPAGMSNVAEAGMKPTADGSLGSYQLVAQKMAVFVVVSDELLAEASGVDIVSFYQDAITQQMAKLIDVHGLAGGGPFGTESLAGAAAAAAGAHVQSFTGTIAAPTGVVPAFTNAMNAVEADDYVPTGFLGARPVKGLFRSLVDGGGRPLLMESFTADVPDQLYGEPIYWLGRGVFPTGASALRAIVGDFSQYVIGIRDELTFSLHNEGTIELTPGNAATAVNLLQQNLTALRAELRLGAKVIDNKSFARVNQPAT